MARTENTVAKPAIVPPICPAQVGLSLAWRRSNQAIAPLVTVELDAALLARLDVVGSAEEIDTEGVGVDGTVLQLWKILVAGTPSDGKGMRQPGVGGVNGSERHRSRLNVGVVMNHSPSSTARPASDDAAAGSSVTAAVVSVVSSVAALSSSP